MNFSNISESKISVSEFQPFQSKLWCQIQGSFYCFYIPQPHTPLPSVDCTMTRTTTTITTHSNAICKKPSYVSVLPASPSPCNPTTKRAFHFKAAEQEMDGEFWWPTSREKKILLSEGRVCTNRAVMSSVIRKCVLEVTWYLSLLSPISIYCNG